MVKWWKCETCNLTGMTKTEAKQHQYLSGHKVKLDTNDSNDSNNSLIDWARIISSLGMWW